MEYKGMNCSLENFDVKGAQANTSFDVSIITNEFQSFFEKQLKRKGFNVSSADSKGDLLIKGEFIKIDEGNRALRYILTFLAGKAVVEVEGEAVLSGQQIAKLNAVGVQTWGLFGGNSQALLKLCARACAKRCANQTISSLKRL